MDKRLISQVKLLNPWLQEGSTHYLQEEEFRPRSLTRSYRSFLQAYRPPIGVIISKNQVGQIECEGCQVHFIPVRDLQLLFNVLAAW